ncbi:hypothetical protein CRE_23758 [Caenorhabditis remanei]|uniref:Uncharacterized protein n=1 Tax=Caenorhabditis remanei TaxID=31234 RepID=E3NHS3_CAERE|nr:hypothetical protein CRE_23758 [Caenorhabditis remanei]
MNASPPLAYQSLKAVLPYMYTTLRINLTVRCPSLRSVDKTVPLTIDSFEPKEHSFIIDDMEYEIGLFKEYPEGSCPDSAKRDNKNGGLESDIDQYGFEDWSTRGALTPGDTDLREWRKREYKENPGLEVTGLDEHERNLRVYREQLAVVESFGPVDLRSDPIHSSEKINQIMNRFMDSNTTTDLLNCYREYKEFEFARALAHETLRDHIMRLEPLLESFYCRRDRRAVPFNSFIMLTIKSSVSGVTKTVEMVKYEKKLHEALKYLIFKIFGGRLHPVTMNTIYLSGETIIRFPPELKIKLRNIDTSADENLTLEALNPFIDETCYPLKSIKFEVSDSRIFENPVVRSAEELVVSEPFPRTDWVPIFLNLPNKKIHLLYDGNVISVDGFIALIRHYMSAGKEVGASFTYGLSAEITMEGGNNESDEFLIALFRKIRKEFKESKSWKRRAHIPTTDGKTLVVSTVACEYMDDYCVQLRIDS